MSTPAAAQAFSALLHAGLVVALWQLPAPVADAEQVRDDLPAWTRRLDARGLALGRHLQVWTDDDAGPSEPAAPQEPERGSGARSLGEEGSMGRHGAPRVRVRAGVQGPPEPADPRLAREPPPLGVAWPELWLYPPVPAPDPDAPTAPWGKVLSEGADASSARAPLWGDSIHDALGPGGLGMSGRGEGGGSDARAIGLGAIGLGSNLALEGASADHRGMTTCGHSVTAPAPRVTVDSTSCRLPSESIQRTVRLNMGRFRLCYEDGLRTRPTLHGRVTTRFVIARDGSVPVATDGGSDLPATDVVSCITRAFRTLSFSAPKEGVVTVDYPLVLSPE